MEKIQVLVVDDEKIMRDGSERILTKEGWNAITADSGLQGLELIKQKSFHILLLDLMMPGMSGMEVLKEVRNSQPGIVVIVITGYATIETAVEAMKAGAYDFIPKPFTPEQLRIVVRRAIEKLTLEREAEQHRLERHRSLRDIANEKNRTRTIINYITEGLLVTDELGNIVLYNPAVTRILSLEEKPPLGKNLYEWTKHKELSGMVEKVLGSDDSKCQGASQEFVLGDPPQSLVAHCAPVRTEEGKLLGSVTLFHDVTCFKEIDQMKSDFVNMVSHELRSPLSAIRQQLSVMVDGMVGTLSEEQKLLLIRAQTRIDGLMSMVGNLLDLSRIEEGQHVQREHIVLSEITDEIIELMRPEAEKKNLELNVTIDSDISPIHADFQGVETIIKNLISNAIKYTSEGGGVGITAQNRGGYIEIKVSDTGVGIAKENLSRIFDRFFRIRNEYTRKVVGSGIGLPLVKAIVDAHFGKISVESELNKGTTFTVILPRGVRC